uniref:Reverse transcriptase domain-containing protein n=1 Tax=Cajanus cajan TaxID=3821 RepID=A0A151T052_CAJCA|nr:hypothetical protein KK1_022773 [Cajanus cajan]
MRLCMTSVNFSILMNGETSEPVIPTHGLRHSDPLSPYLFILYAEGLSTLLKN